MKTFKNESTAQKSAESRTKKTGTQYLVYPWGEAWAVLTEAEYLAESATESSIHVSEGFENIDTDPQETPEQMVALQELEEVLGGEEEPQEVVQEEMKEEDMEEVVQEVKELIETIIEGEQQEEQQEEQEEHHDLFPLKLSYTVTVKVPYLGLQIRKSGGAYLKTMDSQGNRIRLANSRVWVKLPIPDGVKEVTIMTTPTYVTHRSLKVA